jgi:RHS repeat-associated protein
MKEPCEKGVALHLGLESCANLPQGVCEALTGYDSLNRVSAIRHLQCEDTPAYHREAYTYNAASMRTRIDVEKASGGSMLMPDSHKLYKYDALLRLTEEHKRRAGDNVSLYRYAYNYDAAGNRTQLVNFTGATTQTTTYVYNNGNQLTNSQGPGLDDDILYGYDTNGNMISALDQGPYTGKHYNHNRENRLTGVEYDDGKDGLNPLATYTYDALGRRIMRTDPQGNKLRYWYDGLGILLTKEKLSGASAWRTKQVYTLKQAALGHIISERTNTAWNAQGAATAWTDKWFHFDLLGNTTGELNAYGSVITYIDMEAFGTVLSGGQNGYRLTTKGYDPDAGLYYFNARWYNNIVCLLIEQDPYASEHPYNLAGQQPTELVDPAGLYKVDPITCPGESGRDKIPTGVSCVTYNTITDPKMKSCVDKRLRDDTTLITCEKNRTCATDPFCKMHSSPKGTNICPNGLSKCGDSEVCKLMVHEMAHKCGWPADHSTYKGKQIPGEDGWFNCEGK